MKGYWPKEEVEDRNRTSLFEHKKFPVSPNTRQIRKFKKAIKILPGEDSDGPHSRDTISSKGSDVSSLKLPEIILKSEKACPLSSYDLPPDHGRYANTQRAKLRRIGVKFEDLHCSGRTILNKKDQKLSDVEIQEKIENCPNLRTNGKFQLPSIQRKFLVASWNSEDSTAASPEQCPLSRTGYSEVSDNVIDGEKDSTNESLTRHCQEVLDNYMGNSGCRKLHSKKRKLGNVVSNHRLVELLQGRKPLKMENCYNYYL